MGVGDREDDQRGLGARWGTNLQTGGVEQRNHLWRAERKEHNCRGEESRSPVEMVLSRSRSKQGTQARNQRRWQETDGPVAEAVTALASSA